MTEAHLSLGIQLLLLSLLPLVSASISIECQNQASEASGSPLQSQVCSKPENVELHNPDNLQYYGYYYVDDWDWHHQQEVESGEGKWARVTSLEPGTPDGGWDDDLFTVSQFTNLIQVHWRSKPGFVGELASTETLSIFLQLDYRCRKTAFGNCSELEGFDWHQSKAGSTDWARYQLEQFLTWFDPNRERANRIVALYIVDEPSGQGIRSDALDRWAKKVKTVASELYDGYEFKTMVVFSSAYDYDPADYGSLGSGSGPYYYNEHVPPSIDIITIEPYPELFGSISHEFLSKLEDIKERIGYLDLLIRYAAHVTYGWAETVAKGRPIFLQGQAYDKRYWWDAEQYEREIFEEPRSLTSATPENISSNSIKQFLSTYPPSQMLYAANYWTYYNIASRDSVRAAYHLPEKDYDTNTIGLLWFYYPLSREEFHPEDPQRDIWTTQCQIGSQILFNGTRICPPPRLNHPPTVAINLPFNGSTYFEDETITFVGLGTDEDGDLLTYSWDSSIDGEFGNLSKVHISRLSVGNHIISLQVSDGNASSILSIVVEIVEPMPLESNESPQNGEVPVSEETVTIVVEIERLFAFLSIFVLPVVVLKRKRH